MEFGYLLSPPAKYWGFRLQVSVSRRSSLRPGRKVTHKAQVMVPALNTELTDAARLRVRDAGLMVTVGPLYQVSRYGQFGVVTGRGWNTGGKLLSKCWGNGPRGEQGNGLASLPRDSAVVWTQVTAGGMGLPCGCGPGGLMTRHSQRLQQLSGPHFWAWCCRAPFVTWTFWAQLLSP